MSRGPFQPGDQCNQYRIVRALGRGGFGCVYEAVREFQIPAKGVMQQFGQRVALKCLQLDQVNDAHRIERLSLEAVLLMDLKHDNIVGFLDWGITEAGVVYFAMDLLGGKTLGERMRAKPFSVVRALHVAREIAEGLAYAHKKRVTHRDLKPANVFVNDRWDIKVLDLGAAKYEYFWGLSATTGPSPCTVTYAAPEQLDGTRDIDHRADIFALGVIAYEMLTGEHPFSGTARTAGEYVSRQLDCNPRPLSEFAIPPYVASVVHRALSKDRADRYPSMDDMLVDLEAAFARYADERKRPDDEELVRFAERKHLQARMQQGDDSDQGANPTWNASDAPTPQRAMVFTDAPTSPVERRVLNREAARSAGPQGSANVFIDGRPAASFRDEAQTGRTHDGARSKNDASSVPPARRRSDGWDIIGHLYERTPRIAAVLAAGLLIVPVGWVLLVAPRRIREIRAVAAASSTTASSPVANAEPASATALTISKISNPPAGQDERTTTSSVALRPVVEEPRPLVSTTSIEKPKVAPKKRPSPLQGIHVPRWETIAASPELKAPGDEGQP